MNLVPPSYDVITLGETMARFTPPGFERFGQSPVVEIHVGGSESNTAVGLARLGHKVAWISRLTNNPIGRWIAGQIASHGVDVSFVQWTDDDRVGTYYMERGRPPRGSQVFYDRRHSAMSHMLPHEVPSELFTAQRARIFHTTGITLGLGEAARRTAERCVQLARAGGLLVSFDLNYRSKLWSAADAYLICEPFMAQADVIFMAIRDAHAVCGAAAEDSAESVCRQLHPRWPGATLVITRGSLGAVALDPQGTYFEQAAFPADEVERLGGGDAFSAGYLCGLLEGQEIPSNLRWGCAAAAFKYTLPGDLPLLDRSPVERLACATSPRSSSLER